MYEKITPSNVLMYAIRNYNNPHCEGEKEFEVWGTGKPLREFLYVDDLANAITFIIENNIEDELINIGSNQEISIKELVNSLMEVISFEGKITFNNDYPDGNPRKLLDSSKISSYGWKPKVQIDEGLKLTYSWYLNNLNKSSP